MTVSPRMRITGIIMGIISLPMIIFFTFSLVKSQHIQYNDEEMLVHEHAVNLSRDIGSALLDWLLALDHIGFAYNELSQDERLRSQLIQHFLVSRDEVTDIAVVDSRGKEVMHKRPGASGATPLVDRSQNIEFLTLKRTGYYLGPLYLSQGRPLVLMGRAIFSPDGKSMRGGVFTLLKADFILDELKRASMQEGTTAFIVNEKGEITAHPTLSYVNEAKDLSHNPAVELAIGNDAAPARIYTNELTEHVVGAAAPLVISSGASTEIKTNWFVILETPAAAALGAAVAGRNAAALALLILLACVAAAAVVLAPRIGTPLDTVVRALKELNAGNVDYRVPFSDRADLKVITTGVNSLAETLKGVTQAAAEEKRAALMAGEKRVAARSEIVAPEIVAIKADQFQSHPDLADVQKIIGEPGEQRAKQAKRKNGAVTSRKPKVHL